MEKAKDQRTVQQVGQRDAEIEALKATRDGEAAAAADLRQRLATLTQDHAQAVAQRDAALSAAQQNRNPGNLDGAAAASSQNIELWGTSKELEGSAMR